MKLEQLLIGLVMFSVFMIGGALITHNLGNNYGVIPNGTVFNGTTNENNTNSVYNTMNQMSSLSGEIENKTTSSTEGVSEESGLDILFAGGYSALKLVGKSFTLVKNIIYEIGMQSGSSFVANIVAPAFFMIFIFTLVFTILYMLFRFKP